MKKLSSKYGKSIIIKQKDIYEPLLANDTH